MLNEDDLFRIHQFSVRLGKRLPEIDVPHDVRELILDLLYVVKLLVKEEKECRQNLSVVVHERRLPPRGFGV
jgi:hypothetical protein